MADDADTPPAARPAISAARSAASRRNGAAGRGPRGAAGKEAASRNALSHGLTAVRWAVLDDEPADQLHELRARMLDWLRPAGPVEEDLAEQVVLASWRLHRAVRVESEAWRALRRREEADDGLPADLGEALIRDGAGSLALDRIQRHRAAAERSQSRALRMLAALRGHDAMAQGLRGDAAVDAGTALAARPYLAVARDPVPAADGLDAVLIAADAGPATASLTFPVEDAAHRLDRLRRHGSLVLEGEVVGPVTRAMAGRVDEPAFLAHLPAGLRDDVLDEAERLGDEAEARAQAEAADRAAAEMRADERARAARDAFDAERRASEDAWLAARAADPSGPPPPLPTHSTVGFERRAAPIAGGLPPGRGVLQNEPEPPAAAEVSAPPAPHVHDHAHLRPAREKWRGDLPWAVPKEFLKGCAPPPRRPPWQT